MYKDIHDITHMNVCMLNILCQICTYTIKHSVTHIHTYIHIYIYIQIYAANSIVTVGDKKMYAYIYVCVYFDVDPYADVDRSTDSEIAGWMDGWIG